MKENLLIIISTNNVDSILKFPLLYGGVSIPRIEVAKNDEKVRQKVQDMQKDGVEFSSCIVCAQEYDAVESLEAINIPCNHTGELLNEALQNDKLWATLTV